MKINFTEFALVGIDWKEVQSEVPFHKIIGNKLWEFSRDIEMKQKAEAIWKGEEVELNSQQADFVKSTISDEKSQLLPFFGREVSSFIDKH